MEHAGLIDRFTPPVVLINGNFPLANPRFHTPQKEADVQIRTFGRDPEVIRARQRLQGMRMEAMIDLANRLAGRYPQATFIFRPHPFENPEPYRRKLAQRSNLVFAQEGTVDAWILSSVAVIHRSCSTALEAALSDVPALSCAWMQMHPAAELETAEAVSVRCKDESTLTAHLEACLRGEFAWPETVRENVRQVEQRWFYRVDGRSHLRAAEGIEKALREEPSQIDEALCRKLAAGEQSLRRRVSNRLRKLLRLPEDFSLLRMRRVQPGREWDASAKAFDADQVARLLRALRRAAKNADEEQQRLDRPLEAGPAREEDYPLGCPPGRSIRMARSDC
jgi:hypothetical protein